MLWFLLVLTQLSSVVNAAIKTDSRLPGLQGPYAEPTTLRSKSRADYRQTGSDRFRLARDSGATSEQQPLAAVLTVQAVCYRVFKNAISEALSSAVSARPN